MSSGGGRSTGRLIGTGLRFGRMATPKLGMALACEQLEGCQPRFCRRAS